MGDSFEKRFKQVAYPLYLKYKNDQKLAELIKYMKKSFMFCDLSRMDSAFFDNFIDEVTQPEDEQSLLKVIEDFVRYLKEIRDEDKVNSYAANATSSAAASGSGTPATESDRADSSQPSTPPEPTKSQMSETDMQSLEVSLKSTEISVIRANSSSSSQATSSCKATTSTAAADADTSNAGKKRKIQLIPLSKSESIAAASSAFVTANDDGDDCVTPKPPPPPSGGQAVENEDDEVPKKILKTSDQSSSDDGESQDESEYLTEKEAKALALIEKYDKYLQELHLRIQKLEKNDFSISEINDSNEKNSSIYNGDRLKERWTKLYKGMTELIKKYPHLVEEDVLMNQNIKIFKDIRFKTLIKVNVSRYPVIDQKVCEHVNKQKEAPNYHDILKIAEETNKSHKLGLIEREVESCAEVILKGVIKELKMRRIRDLVSVQSTLIDEELKMPDDFETDPAEKDLELKKKLDESKAIGERHLNEVVESFVAQQGDKQDSDGEDEQEEDDDEEEEDEEDSSPAAADDELDGCADSETATVTSATCETVGDDSQLSQEELGGELAEIPEAATVAVVQTEPAEAVKSSQEPVSGSQKSEDLTLKDANLNQSGSDYDMEKPLSYFMGQPDSNDDEPIAAAEVSEPKKDSATITPSSQPPPPPSQTRISKSFQYFPILSADKTRINKSMPLIESKQTALPNRSIVNPDEPIVID